jgi:hypothetical protein
MKSMVSNGSLLTKKTMASDACLSIRTQNVTIAAVIVDSSKFLFFLVFFSGVNANVMY